MFNERSCKPIKKGVFAQELASRQPALPVSKKSFFKISGVASLWGAVLDHMLTIALKMG